MESDVMKLLAHLDQTRASVTETVMALRKVEVARLIKTCAAGAFEQMDEDHRRLVGLLAVVAIFDLVEASKDKEC